MARSESLRETQKLQVSDLDMAAAAQQLLLLSDEDSNSNSNSNISSSSRSSRSSSSSNIIVKKISLDDHECQEEIFDQRSRDEITWKKIEEIFGREEEVCRPKKRRYRSLDSIYQSTKPICR